MSICVENKRALFDYEILEKFQAGVELTGSEVKSLRLGRGSLEGSRIVIKDNEAFLINVNVPPYQPGNMPTGYDQGRTRRLLLTKKEIGRLVGRGSKKGLTIIPLSVYNLGRCLKVKIAVVRAKKKYDKREVIKQREAERELRRTLKSK